MMKFKQFLFFSLVIICLLSTFYLRDVNAANCAPGDLFHSVTGARCSGAVSVSECLPGHKFSAITGRPCINNNTGLLFARDIKITKPLTRGNDILILQNLLKENGYFPSDAKLDGVYGPVTVKALANFQKNNKLPESQTVNLATRNLLNGLLNNSKSSSSSGNSSSNSRRSSGGTTNNSNNRSASNTSIVLLSPNGGQTWYLGNSYNVTWRSTGVDKVLLYGCNSSGSCQTLKNMSSDGVSNTGSYTVKADDMPYTGSVKIRVSDANPRSVYDDSDDYISVLAPAVQTLSITTPSVLPNAKVGQPYSVALNASGGSGSNYSWYYTDGGFPISGLGLAYSVLNPTYISGSPNKIYVNGIELNTPKTFTFSISVANGSQTTSKQFTLTVDPATPTPVVTEPPQIINLNVKKSFSGAFASVSSPFEFFKSSSSSDILQINWGVSGTVPPELTQPNGRYKFVVAIRPGPDRTPIVLTGTSNVNQYNMQSITVQTDLGLAPYGSGQTIVVCMVDRDNVDSYCEGALQGNGNPKATLENVKISPYPDGLGASAFSALAPGCYSILQLYSATTGKLCSAY